MRGQIGATHPNRITINGVELAYDDEGNGPVLLCLHAIAHGAGDYAPLRARLARRYRVIALDWPGHGASDSEAAEPTDERYSEHLAAFVEALGLEQITLIGNSVGGAAAIRFASSRPEKVRALIVANPAGLFMRPPGFSLLLKLVSRIFAAGAAGARWFPSVFAAYYKRILLREPAAEQRARIVAAGYELAPMLARAWHGFGQPSADVRSLAAQVRCPVLVAWSVRDPANKLWMNRAGIARFPDRQLVEFDGGHTPFLEMPDQFVSTFDAFMHRIGLAAVVRVPQRAKTEHRRR